MTKFYIAAIATLAAIAAQAGGIKPPAVPEIDALAGFAAIAVVGGAVALIWEKRRR